ncbi:hypothetical protein Q1695_009704 [Nippostrongylus brasiliensis]|nr:hypothetical protein Q1695_009704 [Nippostrongylus brasiliensis]
MSLGTRPLCAAEPEPVASRLEVGSLSGCGRKHWMSQEGTELVTVKNEEYTPSFVTANTAFDPQVASFFYEGNGATAPSSSSSALNTVPKLEPSDNLYNASSLRHAQPAAPSHDGEMRDYASYQRQCQQQSLMQQRQQYYTQTVQLPQQRDYLIRQGHAIAQRFPISPVQPGIHYYGRASNAQEQQVIAAQAQNMSFPVMRPVLQQPQQRPQRNSVVPIERAPFMVRQRGPAAVHPQLQYGTAAVANVRTGIPYGSEQVYVRYEGDVNHPVYSTYPTEVPISDVSSMQQTEGVPVQCQYPQYPVEYVMYPGEYDNNVDFKDVVKMEPCDQPTAIETASKMRRKRSKAVKATDIMGEGDYGDCTPQGRKRTNKRKKFASELETGDQSFTEHSGTSEGPSPPLTQGELLKQKKKNMAFPKGTFLVRYADLDSDEYAGHIWLVDNHQLLQKYTYDGLDSSNVKVFSRTERYSGWLCTCPWLYHPLTEVRGILGNFEKVSVTNHPTRDELLARREEERKKAPELNQDSLDVTQDGSDSEEEHSCDDNEEESPIKQELEDPSYE